MMRALVLVLLASVVVAGGGAAYLYHSGYFEDPAIRGCEAVLLVGLKSPSSYKRAEAAILRNNVVIKYDAQNSYGATLRSDYLCTFTYERGQYSLRLDKSTDNPADILKGMHQSSALYDAVGYSIPQEKTSLRPSREDSMTESCLSQAVKKHDNVMPSRDNFLSIALEKNPTTETLRFYKKNSAMTMNLPDQFWCVIAKDGSVKLVE